MVSLGHQISQFGVLSPIFGVSEARGLKFGTWLYCDNPHATDKNEPQKGRGVVHVLIVSSVGYNDSACCVCVFQLICHLGSRQTIR